MAKTKESNELTSISRNRAIKIFETLGFKTANKWDNARLQKNVGKLTTLIEGADLDDKTQKRVNAILRAQEDGVKVTVDSENPAADKQAEKDVKAAAKREVNRKAEKKSKAEKTTEKQEKIKKDAEKSEKKSGKKTVKKATKTVEKSKNKSGKKTAKKTEKKDKKPGVIMSVLEFVKTHGPVSEKKIHSLLKKRFPDRDSGSMGRSIPKIPGHLRSTKNMDVIGKDDKGRYYIKK